MSSSSISPTVGMNHGFLRAIVDKASSSGNTVTIRSTVKDRKAQKDARAIRQFFSRRASVHNNKTFSSSRGRNGRHDKLVVVILIGYNTGDTASARNLDWLRYTQPDLFALSRACTSLSLTSVSGVEASAKNSSGSGWKGDPISNSSCSEG